MKKLLAFCVAMGMSCVALAGMDSLEQAIKQQAKAVESADAINSVIEVSFDVKTIFSMTDILDKNGEHLSYGYKVPGKTLEETNWNLDEVDYKFVIIQGQTSDYHGPTIINENNQDKDGFYYSIVKNYNYQRKGCSMFLIDENWLMGSIECIGSETKGTVGYTNYILTNVPYEIDNKVIEGDLIFEYSNNHKVKAKNRIFKGPNVVLVYIGNSPAKKLMAGKPVAHVLFFKNNIFDLLKHGTVGEDFKIRTSRFATGAIKDRSLKAGSYHEGRFELDDSLFDLSATGGDPLFYVAKSSGIHYLVGFNAGKINATVSNTAANLMTDYKGEVVNSFFDFHTKDYEFVMKTISSKSLTDWERVKTRLVWR